MENTQTALAENIQFKMTPHQRRRARNIVNSALFELGRTYHDHIPVTLIDNILSWNEFYPTEPAIYCGRDGNSHENVGHDTWLSMSWHKMGSGRYEIVAYVS